MSNQDWITVNKGNGKKDKQSSVPKPTNQPSKGMIPQKNQASSSSSSFRPNMRMPSHPIPRQGMIPPYPLHLLYPNQINQSQFSPVPPSYFGHNPWTPVQTSYSQIAKEAEHFLKQQKELEAKQVSDFYNPGLSKDIYDYLNEIWKAHLLDKRSQFRKSMGKFANLLLEKQQKEKDLHITVLDSIKSLAPKMDVNITVLEKLIQLYESIESSTDDSNYNKIKRCFLFEKAKELGSDIFFKINQGIVKDQLYQIPEWFKKYNDNTYFSSKLDNLKMHFLINHEPWNVKYIEWGLVGHITFQNVDWEELAKLPMFIKSMLYDYIKDQKYVKYYTFEISSNIGYRERERFYQPYQIWFLREAREVDFGGDDLREIGSARVNSAIESYDFSDYYIKSLYELSIEAAKFKPVSNLDVYTRVTDGRRIFITYLKGAKNYGPEHDGTELVRQISNLDLTLDLPMDHLMDVQTMLEEDLLGMEAIQRLRDESLSEDSNMAHNIENMMEP